MSRSHQPAQVEIGARVADQFKLPKAGKTAKEMRGTVTEIGGRTITVKMDDGALVTLEHKEFASIYRIIEHGGTKQ